MKNTYDVFCRWMEEEAQRGKEGGGAHQNVCAKILCFQKRLQKNERESSYGIKAKIFVRLKIPSTTSFKYRNSYW